MNMLTRLRTYIQLGPANIARVAAYRLGLKAGWHSVQRLSAPVSIAPYFHPTPQCRCDLTGNTTWDRSIWWFDWKCKHHPHTPPDWFENAFAELQTSMADLDWWRIPDFNAVDIKSIWEISRFNWVIAWATKAAKGDIETLEKLNLWLSDWALSNPPYKGHNWKCGQEASIRVLHLIVAAWVLRQSGNPESGLVDLLRVHLQRIAPTVSYAIGQQNNHGTSEAAALFIGGSFLAGHDPRAKRWERKGRRLLENRAKTLVEVDGSFSQHSVNYHRLMLDTFSLAEAWRRHCELPPFSERLNDRLAAAAEWLWLMTDADTGDAPNIGANDGARLMPLTGGDYRDYRPSVQLATALFGQVDAFGEGPWMEQLRWLEVADQSVRITPHSKSFDDGGYHVLRTDCTLAVLRYPRFKFRPSQADALHVDLWHNGTNLLRDAGTFSYNKEGAEWFSGTAAHNTVEFDDRDQMPRLGRFLFGDWLTTNDVTLVREEAGTVTAAAGYVDAQGARHHRAITLTNGGLICTDTISGSFKNACLRWRLASGDWRVNNNILKSEHCEISIEINGTHVRPTLGATEESRYYLHKSAIPVTSVNIDNAATIITKVTF
ncbi:MAG: hypothetical protein ACI9A2_003025 [Halioglobus sp.]|jgi:hypothetical protein